MSDAPKPSLVERLQRRYYADACEIAGTDMPPFEEYPGEHHEDAQLIICGIMRELAAVLREMPEGLVIAGQRAIDLRGSVGHPRAVIAAVADWLDREAQK